MPLDSNHFASLLANSLEKLLTLTSNVTECGAYLRFPSGSTYLGSEVGMEFWASDAAGAMLEYLLTDPDLRRWFAPPPDHNLIELRGMLASVVEQWVDSEDSPTNFAIKEASNILAAIGSPDTVYWGISLAHGVEATDPILLPHGLSVVPWDETGLKSLPRTLPISELDVMRFPRGPLIRLGSNVLVKREELGSIAGASARNFAQIALERLRTAVWMASGALPAKGDIFLRHHAPYPVMPVEREAPFLWERFAVVGEGANPPTVDPAILWGAVARSAAIFGQVEVLDEDTWGRLRAGMTYADPALASSDGMMTLFMAYAALDGLLLDEKDHHSRLGPRVARLIGGSDADRKYLRKLVSNIYELRGSVAHGRQPMLARVAEALGREVTDAEWQARWLSLDLEISRLARSHSLALLRRALIAFLWLTITADPTSDESNPAVRSQFTRAAVIDLLDRGERNDGAANEILRESIPTKARESSFIQPSNSQPN